MKWCTKSAVLATTNQNAVLFKMMVIGSGSGLGLRLRARVKNVVLFKMKAIRVGILVSRFRVPVIRVRVPAIRVRVTDKVNK